MNINQDILKKVLKKNNFSEADLLAIYDGKIQVSNNYTPQELLDWISENSVILNSALPVDSQILDGGAISAEAMPGISVDPYSDGNELAHNNTVSFDGNTTIHIVNSKSLKNWTVFFDLNINFPSDKTKATILLTNKEYIDDEDPGLWMIFINAAGFLCYEYINANGEKIGHACLSHLPEKCLIAASKRQDGLISFYIYDPVAEKINGKESFVINEPPLDKDWAIGGSKKHFEVASPPNCYKCLDEYQNFLFCFSTPAGADQDYAHDKCVELSGDPNASISPSDPYAFCCVTAPPTTAPPTTTTFAPTCDLTEMFNHVKGNITANGGVFLGDWHGTASVTGWISAHVATLGINVFFIEMVESEDQAVLDNYINVNEPRHGTPEHCALIEEMSGWDPKEDFWCCPDAWDPDNFADEYIRVIDACIAAGIVVKAIDVYAESGQADLTDAERSAHWANIVNAYLTTNPNHKFIIYGGGAHAGAGGSGGMEDLITSVNNAGKTLIKYGFDGIDGLGAEDCDGTVDHYPLPYPDGTHTDTGLGAYENSPCMCMIEGSPPGVPESNYTIFVNACNQAKDEYVDWDCSIITQLVRPACPTTTTAAGNYTRVLDCQNSIYYIVSDPTPFDVGVGGVVKWSCTDSTNCQLNEDYCGTVVDLDVSGPVDGEITETEDVSGNDYDCDGSYPCAPTGGGGPP